VRKLIVGALRGLLFFAVAGSLLVVASPAMAAAITQTAPFANATPAITGTMFSFQLQSTGGDAGLAYADTGAVVQGITVSGAGLISSDGTTPSGSYTLSGTDTDTALDTGTWTFALTVGVVLTQSAPMSNSSTDVFGSPFSDQLVTSAPSGTEMFVQSSSFTGISVSTTGLITSTSAVPVGTYVLSGTDSDTGGDAGTWTYSLTVSTPPGGGGGSPPVSGKLTQTSASTGSTTPIASATFAIAPLAVSGATGVVTYVTTKSSTALNVSAAGVITTTGVLIDGVYVVSGTDSDTSGDAGTWAYTLTVNAASVSVTFNANGGTGSMAVETESAATKLAHVGFTRVGYTFAGWNTVANGSGTSYADEASYPFTASITLYAQWSAIPVRNVIFTPNGGTGTMLPQAEDVPTALTTNSYTRVGFKFAGWNTAANGSGTSYANGATYAFSAGVTLYAQWSNGKSFVVTFKANGGSGSMAPESKRTQGTLTLNRFTRPQHRFFKWTTVPNGSGSSYANGATYLFTKSMTLYAQWNIIKKPVVLPAVHAVITLSPFAPNSSSLSGALQSQISALASKVKANRDTKIALVGYSGKLAAVNNLNEAAWAANLKISGERAVNVEAFLKQRLSALGVHNVSISAVGTGDSNPPGAIATAVTAAKNRCVVATIT
jgi:uncharacterized repeat protein (TIGR02543 family)